jgi:hypothetical protein
LAGAILAPAQVASASGAPAGHRPDASWRSYPVAGGGAGSRPAGDRSGGARSAPVAGPGGGGDGAPIWLLLAGGVLVGAAGGLILPLRTRWGRTGAAPRPEGSRSHDGGRGVGTRDGGPARQRPRAAVVADLFMAPAPPDVAVRGRPPQGLRATRPASGMLRLATAERATQPLPLSPPLQLLRSGLGDRVWPRLGERSTRWILAGILVIGATLRLWQINAVGLNSDEAVYSGQGASIAGDPQLSPFFPTFRAHPLLFQSLVSIGYLLHTPEVFGRLAAVVLGLATIYVTYLLGRLLYGNRAGLIAAGLMALMPYHVVVTRQILLDGPRTLMSTVTLYLLARFALTERVTWFYAAAAGLGLTFLCKEDSVIMLGAFYAFLALTPALRTGVRHIVGAGALFAVLAAAYPLSLKLAHHTSTGGHFIVWQLFRRPNHAITFYPTVVPVAIGLGVVIAAGLGLWLLLHESSWRETLLLSWIAVPACFFQLFPVKGFQYLLPIAPAIAVLAARFFAHWDPRTLPAAAAERSKRRVVRLAGGALAQLRRRWLMPVALMAVLISLAVPSWHSVDRAGATTFLAGSGGLPGGREAGRWIGTHVPASAQMMSIGPSMANVLEFYGHRKIYGLSVSPNPLHRNPVYEAMRNPDQMIRDNDLQYIVWDAFSADRSPFFAAKMMRFVERYHGHVAHTESVPAVSPDGHRVRTPVVIIYEVSP